MGFYRIGAACAHTATRSAAAPGRMTNQALSAHQNEIGKGMASAVLVVIGVILIALAPGKKAATSAA